jgi:hypothetical protein
MNRYHTQGFRSKRISRKESTAIDALYRPIKEMTNMTNQKAVPLSKAVAVREQHEFIKPDDLGEIEYFDLVGARRFTGESGKQILFDVEYQVTDKKTKKTHTEIRSVTLSENEEREELMQAIKQHKRIGPVKLEKKPLRDASRSYIRFIEAEIPF